MRSHTTLLVILASALGGCVEPDAVDDTEDADEADDLTTIEQNASAYNAPFDVVIPPSTGWYEPGYTRSTHVCYLTAIQGTFHGDGHRVLASQAGSKWTFNSNSAGGGASGTITCAGVKWFQTESGSAHWASPITYSSAYYFDVCANAQDFGWKGDSVMMLTGIAGQLSGPAQGISTTQPPNTNKKTYLYTQDCTGGSGVAAYAVNLFVGEPHVGATPWYYNDLYGRTQISGVTWASAAPGETERVWLAPIDEAACYLSGLAGDLSGPDDQVAIERVSGWYRLRVTSGSGTGLWANARCYSRYQD
jgi:hypothetical protein